MLIRILFWLFLLAAFALIFRFGGKTERGFAGFLLACTVLTFVASRTFGISAAFKYVLLIDAAILVVALWLTARANSYWPIWFSGFHLIAVATGLAYLLFPPRIPGLYGDAAGFWALPALLAMVLGILADHRMHNPARAGA